MREPRRFRRVMAPIVVMALVVIGAAHAAAPRYMLVSGPGLDRPVLLGDWDENLAFLTSMLPAKQPTRGWQKSRPRYSLALFWGVPAKPVPTRPRDANQHGWFYPALGRRRAVVKLLISGRDLPRVATPAALRILARHGIPTSGRSSPYRPCPVTRPSSRPVVRSFNYGSETLAVNLWRDGVLIAGVFPDGGAYATVNRDGSIDAKQGWWRASGGHLRIVGRRLDAPASPLRANVPAGYGNGFQATGLTFPTTGCWRVTGSVGRASLSYVVRVVKL